MSQRLTPGCSRGEAQCSGHCNEEQRQGLWPDPSTCPASESELGLKKWERGLQRGTALRNWGWGGAAGERVRVRVRGRREGRGTAASPRLRTASRDLLRLLLTLPRSGHQCDKWVPCATPGHALPGTQPENCLDESRTQAPPCEVGVSQAQWGGGDQRPCQTVLTLFPLLLQPRGAVHSAVFQQEGDAAYFFLVVARGCRCRRQVPPIEWRGI